MFLLAINEKENDRTTTMGDVGRYHFLGFTVSGDTFRNAWEVVQPARKGALEVSYRWFRTCKDAEGWSMRNGAGAPKDPGKPRPPAAANNLGNDITTSR